MDAKKSDIPKNQKSGCESRVGAVPVAGTSTSSVCDTGRNLLAGPTPAVEVTQFSKKTSTLSELDNKTSHKLLKTDKMSCVKFARIEVFHGVLNPSSIFPEELWDIILRKLSSPDRLAVCRANFQLDSVFGECKNQWLFDKVLPFLMKNFTRKSQLLKCRQVCKNWRFAVNTFLESTHSSRRPYQHSHPIEQMNCRMPSIYSSLRRCNLEYLQFTPNFLHKFSSCPFPSGLVVGRAISFQISGIWTVTKYEEFLEHARVFLESHGENIWHFKYVQYSADLNAHRLFMIIQDFLNLLPNLKTLEIRCNLDKMLTVDENISVAQIIAANSLPSIRSLQCVNIEGVPKIIEEHFIIKFCSQLKRFSVDIGQWHWESEECNLPNNLVELCVRRITDEREHLLQRLHTQTTIPVQCTKLTLDMSSCSWVHASVLQELLKSFQQLSHFRLILYSRARYGCQGYHNSCQVPSVEYFEIEGDGRDLLRFGKLFYAFPNLKYLHFRDVSFSGHNGTRQVKQDEKKDEDTKLEIERYLFANKVEESPIWDTLDQLQVLTYESVNGSFRRFCNRNQVNWRKKGNAKQDQKEVMATTHQ